MKKIKNIGIAALSAILLVSCGSEPEKVEEEIIDAGCMYSYNEVGSNVGWTAYKFNEKTPVAGTFTEIKVEGEMKSDDPMAILKSLSFSIPTSTVNSNNTERDPKIMEHFFGLLNIKEITGKVVSLADDGKAVIEITMNNMSKKVEGTYTFVDDKFDFMGSIDVVNWNAGKGIEKLNEVCYDLHKGADGISKLWSEVGLTFSTTLLSDCD